MRSYRVDRASSCRRELSGLVKWEYRLSGGRTLEDAYGCGAPFRIVVMFVQELMDKIESLGLREVLSGLLGGHFSRRKTLFLSPIYA